MSTLRNDESAESAESTDASVSGDASRDADGSSDPPVELADVEFGYTATPVVEDISLRIDPGEYVIIVEPNGSGKSTLMKLILGLLRPDEEAAWLLGEPTHVFDDGAHIGCITQHANASKEIPITAHEIVKMGRFPYVGFDRLSAEDHRIVDEALVTVGMSDFADRRVTRLSSGQHQRAFIARALTGEADLFVLDEPTVGVDAESVDAFYDLLESLSEEGVTILLIKYDLGAVIDHARRVVYLNREVYFDDSTDEFVDSDTLARVLGTVAPFAGGSGSSSGTGGLDDGCP